MRLLLFIFIISIISVRSENTKIISLVPSVTETIMHFSKDKVLMGRSIFCKFPENVQSLPAYGTAVTPSWEKIVASKPRLVVLSKSKNTSVEHKMKKLGVPFKTFSFNTLINIYESILGISELVGEKQAGVKFVKTLKQKLKFKPLSLSAIFVIGSSGDKSSIKSLRIAAKGTYYNDLLLALGFKTKYFNLNGYPLVSIESIIKADPDVIFVGHPKKMTNIELKTEETKWRKLGFLNAIKNKNIYHLVGNENLIPGPRISNLIDNLLALRNEIKNK